MDQEQIQALKSVLAPTAVKMFGPLNKTLLECETFQHNLVQLLHKNCAAAIRKPVVFILDLNPRSPGTGTLNATAITRATAEGRAYVHISWNLDILKTVRGPIPTHATCSEISEAASTYVLLLEGQAAYEFVNGRTVSQFDIQNPQTPLGYRGRHQRSINQFHEILADHYQSCLHMETGLRYWADKARRILLVGPDGTEGIFHHNLCWWLKENVVDYIDIYKEPSAAGQDKTDIVIVTAEGCRVIEVKWMGKNSNGTSYGSPVIDQGLIQLKKYLERDAKFVWGNLVIYDGRSKDKHDNDSSHNSGHRHSACDAPSILFLESDIPSQSAKAQIRNEIKKGKKKKNDSND